MAYDNTNSGAVFKNKDRKHDNHPHYRGSAELISPSGERFEVWISAWLKTAGPKAKNPGEQFVSLAFTPKDEQQPSHAGAPVDDIDDIPF